MNPYQTAVAEARTAVGDLTSDQLNTLRRLLQSFADELTAMILKAPAGSYLDSYLRGSRQVVIQEAQELDTLWRSSIQSNRAATYREVQAIWERAAERSVARGVVGVPIQTLGAYERLGGPHWSSVAQSYVRNAAYEANYIIKQGLTSGMQPQDLARRLRPYVLGSKTFYDAFRTVNPDQINWQRLQPTTADEKNALGQLRYNSERIAYSELHNARAEAEVLAFAHDPLVAAVRWRTAPNRGRTKLPDICDVLEQSDFFGLGRGIYPVGRVPLPPHPFDRCERLPVLRPYDQKDRPKPNPGLQRTEPGLSDSTLGRITAAHHEGLKQQTASVLQQATRHPLNQDLDAVRRILG